MPVGLLNQSAAVLTSRMERQLLRHRDR